MFGLASSSVGLFRSAGGLLYNPNDIVGLSNGIKLIIKDKTKRNQMIKKGFYQASKFTWDKHLKETTNVYKKLVHQINDPFEFKLIIF